MTSYNYYRYADAIKIALLAVIALSLVVAEANAQLPTPSANTAGVEVTEKADALSWSEKRFLIRLSQERIPVPERIIIEYAPESMGGKVRGWVDHGERWTIHLTPLRRIDPNATPPSWPYVMGRHEVYPNGMVSPQTFVLAHEMGHMIEPHLRADLGRPALGVLVSTEEIQAEIIGLTLMQITFGISPDQLGFPEKIEYEADYVQDKKTSRLVWQYCEIIKDTWGLASVECRR